jgi:putative flippase GtrA
VAPAAAGSSPRCHPLAPARDAPGVYRCPVSEGGAARAEPLSERLLRFGRALVVGSGATLADLSVFETCVRLLGVAPASARLPALVAGACCQFLGNRTFTFRATSGKLSRQAQLFVVAEAATLLLNWGIFQLLLAYLPATLPPEIVCFFGTFLVFVGFAYPLRRYVVFRLHTASVAVSDAAHSHACGSDEPGDREPG